MVWSVHRPGAEHRARPLLDYGKSPAIGGKCHAVPGGGDTLKFDERLVDIRWFDRNSNAPPPGTISKTAAFNDVTQRRANRERSKFRLYANGESVEDVSSRVFEVISEEYKPDGPDILIVTHQTPLIALPAVIGDVDRDTIRSWKIANAAVG